MSQLKYVLAVTILMISTLGCDHKIAFNGAKDSPSSLNQQPSDPTNVVEPCEPSDTTETKPTKLILVIDQSGSNAASTTGRGTDPDKGLRYAAISELLRAHGGKKHIKWSLITFQMDEATAITKGNTDQTPIFVTGAKMSVALDRFLQLHDGGTTPYLPALTMVQKLIAKDLTEDVNYRVAFITDGYPTDKPKMGSLDSHIDEIMNAITSLSPKKIQFSTVFYGTPDKDAAKRLKRMAKMGHGDFLDASNAQDIHLNDVVKVPGSCKR